MIARSTVSGPIMFTFSYCKISKKKKVLYILTPHEVSAVLERQQTGGKFSRAHHWRKNNLAAVVHAAARDGDHLDL